MHIINGDITTVESGHVIHGCNAHGVMGAGVALAIKNRWPQVFNVYRHKYEKHGLSLGCVIPVFIKNDLVVWNIITQDGYSRHNRMVDYDAVDTGLKNLTNIVDKYVGMFYNVPNDLHFPKIGAGLGGGDWDIILPMLKTHSRSFNLVYWEY